MFGVFEVFVVCAAFEVFDVFEVLGFLSRLRLAVCVVWGFKTSWGFCRIWSSVTFLGFLKFASCLKFLQFATFLGFQVVDFLRSLESANFAGCGRRGRWVGEDQGPLLAKQPQNNTLLLARAPRICKA